MAFHESKRMFVELKVIFNLVNDQTQVATKVRKNRVRKLFEKYAVAMQNMRTQIDIPKALFFCHSVYLTFT